MGDRKLSGFFIYLVAILMTAGYPCLAEEGQAHERQQAIEQAMYLGMDYMIRSALDENNFDEYDSDYLFFFADISRVDDPWIAERARTIGLRLGEYYLENGFLTDSADSIVDAASALWALEQLGMDVDAPLAVLQLQASSFELEDYLGFDQEAGERPDTDLLIDLVIGFHFTDRMAVDVGISYAEVLPYVSQVDYEMDPEADSDDYIDTNNLVTHLIYTLSGYASWHLDESLVDREEKYIRRYFSYALWWADAETLAEYIDSLKLMGYGPEDEQIRAGVELLLATQKLDGHWEPEDVEDEYDRYHATWCAMDALRSYELLGRNKLPDPVSRWVLEKM